MKNIKNIKNLIIYLIFILFFQNFAYATTSDKPINSELVNEIKKEEFPESKNVEPIVEDIKDSLRTGEKKFQFRVERKVDSEGMIKDILNGQ